jgi:hypothetical protein
MNINQVGKICRYLSFPFRRGALNCFRSACLSWKRRSNAYGAGTGFFFLFVVRPLWLATEELRDSQQQDVFSVQVFLEQKPCIPWLVQLYSKYSPDFRKSLPGAIG